MKEILRDKEEYIKKLEEENIKLKKELEKTIYWKVDYEKSYKQADAKRDELLEENKKLKEENSYRAKVVDIIPQDEKSVAEETIQDLQERIRFLEQCLDNKEKVNKSLREELHRYKDMWDSGEEQLKINSDFILFLIKYDG